MHLAAMSTGCMQLISRVSPVRALKGTHMNDPDHANRELINAFVSEGYSMIEDAEAQIGQIGLDGGSDAVHTVFRLFHSIKSTAGYLNFMNISRVTHQAETLLDKFRNGNHQPSQDEIDLVYRTIDFLQQLIANVDRHMTDQGFEEDTDLFVRSLDACTSAIEAQEKRGTPQTGDPAFDIITPGTSPEKQDTDTCQTLITPEMRQAAFSEMLDLVDTAEQIVLQLEASPQDKEKLHEVFRYVHTIKGNAGFLGFVTVEQNSSELEIILDEFRLGKRVIDSNRINQLLRALDNLRSSVACIAGSPQKSEDREDASLRLDEPVAALVGNDTRPIGEILIQMGEVRPEAVERALAQQQPASFRTGTVPVVHDRKDLRVDMTKLDRLFDMVGELVTAESLVVNNPDLSGLVLHGFDKAASMLNKICREIQEITMMIRMIPLEGLFTRMNRLVRDLSRKMGKPVNFQISGEETEMDRSVTEQIADPLVHILRNSIDHGIEDQAVRLARGKNAIGTIHLNARYEGNEVWVSVRDDGAGLNRERILALAREKGLVSGDESNLSDQDVWRLICMPGLSTAEQVSDISGRGVGMDVVRQNIERLRGRLDISSNPGQGTQITMRIPLTMAILDAITVRVGANHYSIPSTDIVELLKAKPQQVSHTTGQGEVLNLRGEILPVVKLWDVFKVETDVREITDGLVVVVQGGRHKACALVDAVVGSQQVVIKGLSDYIGSVEGIAGCSIISDGGISFLLDTSSLINRCLET